MFTTAEKYAAGFIAIIVFTIMALAGYRMTIDKNCVQSAIHQNYPADAIKKICR